MSNFEGSVDINSLATLLQESKEIEVKNSTTQPPISTSSTIIKTGSNISAKPDTINKYQSDIWNLDELPTKDTVLDVKDNRPSPRYEFSYKQSVGTEDVFLGINDKSPSSIDCSHLVVKIYFPGSSLKDLDLDITKNRIQAESKTLRLFTYLPVNVDEKNGSAKFDSSKHVLTIVLPILREDW